MSQNIIINGKVIGGDKEPYIIAELSGNHNGDISRALDIMQAAKKAGADALKLQTYTADTITIDHNGPGFVVDVPLWRDKKLYDLYDEAHTPWEWHEAIFAKGGEIGITVFSSPFDFSSVDFLEELGCPAYKIASPELIDIPLIEKVAATGKPMIMSTGMASLEEIKEAVEAAKNSGCYEIALLHCVSAYPSLPQHANLSNIKELAKIFGVTTGLSDHSSGTAVSVAAVAMGASIIEKHFTLLRADGGVDSAFSLEPEELCRLVEETKMSSLARGGPDIGPKESEIAGLDYRRSLYIVEDIKAGEILTPENLRSIRPGFGLKPKYYKSLIGCRVVCDVKRGEPMDWTFVESIEK